MTCSCALCLDADLRVEVLDSAVVVLTIFKVHLLDSGLARVVAHSLQLGLLHLILIRMQLLCSCEIRSQCCGPSVGPYPFLLSNRMGAASPTTSDAISSSSAVDRVLQVEVLQSYIMQFLSVPSLAA